MTGPFYRAPPQRPAEPGDFDHGIGADRFKVVRGAFWWHVLIGDGTKKYGKFHTQAGAEEMAALLLREFKNGAFVQHRAALAEPVQEPVAWTGYDLDGMVEAFSRVIEAHHSNKHPFHNPIDMDAKMALRILRGFIPAMKVYAAPPQRPAEPVQEPVAWRFQSAVGGWAYGSQPPLGSKYPVYPLYTAPPQRKPLSEDEVLDIARTFGAQPWPPGSCVAFARAVERAHGIGGGA